MARIKFCPGMKASYFVNLNLFCAVFKDIYHAGSFVANFSILSFAFWVIDYASSSSDKNAAKAIFIWHKDGWADEDRHLSVAIKMQKSNAPAIDISLKNFKLIDYLHRSDLWRTA